MIEVIKGNILGAKEKYLAHQCNAITQQAGGLAHYIFRQFPYADIYKDRPRPYRPSGPNFPGHIQIRGDGINNRFIINMIAQYFPGAPQPNGNLLDSNKTRESYFFHCLEEISYIENIESIAFPVFIGCGMAQGNWEAYLAMIESFDLSINKTQKVKTVFYRLD